MRGSTSVLALVFAISGCAGSSTSEPSEPSEPSASAAQIEIAQEVAVAPVVAPPEQEGNDPELARNTVAALVACADRITYLELVYEGQTIMRYDDEVRDEFVESLPDAPPEFPSLSLTSSPWPDYWVLVHVEGREQPFVGSIEAGMGLQLNGRALYSQEIADEDGEIDWDNVGEVGYSERLWDATAEQLGRPTSKEYGHPTKVGNAADEIFEE